MKLDRRLLLGGLEGERVGLEVEALVLGAFERPRRLGASGVGGLRLVRVEAWVALANKERDGGNVDVGAFEPASVILALEPCIEE